jgi:hypothetical protein
VVGAWVGQPTAPGVEHRRFDQALRREMVFTVSAPGPCPAPSTKRDCVQIEFRTLEDTEPGRISAEGMSAVRDVRVLIQGAVLTEAHTLVPHRLRYVKRASFRTAQTQWATVEGVDEFEYTYRYAGE